MRKKGILQKEELLMRRLKRNCSRKMLEKMINNKINRRKWEVIGSLCLILGIKAVIKRL